jgi:hypothetical protein
VTRPDSRLAAALAAVGAFAVGGAIQVRDGYGAPAAFAWLTVAVVAVLAAVVLPTHRTVEALLRRALPALMVAMLVQQLLALVTWPPAGPFLRVPGWPATFALAGAGAVLAAVAVAATRGRCSGSTSRWGSGRCASSPRRTRPSTCSCSSTTRSPRC